MSETIIGDDVKYTVLPGFFGDAYKLKRVSDGEIFTAKVNRNLADY